MNTIKILFNKMQIPFSPGAILLENPRFAGQEQFPSLSRSTISFLN